MNKAQLHLTNFLLLVEEAGSLTKLARACGYETPLLYLSSNAVWNNKQAMSLHAAFVRAWLRSWNPACTNAKAG